MGERREEMPEIDVFIEYTESVNIDVHCAACGAGLCNQTDVRNKNGNIRFDVAPCEKCLASAREGVDV